MSGETGVGAAILRKEDKRFLTGKGNYVADLKLRNMAHGVFLRSHHAHAVIKGIDTAAALAMPGVVAIFTGTDLAADSVGGIPCGWGITNVDGTPMKEPAHPALALGKVRCVGDAVAFVVAETLEEARAAAEAVEVDYEVLPAVVSMLDAIRPGATAIFDDVPDNTCFDWVEGRVTGRTADRRPFRLRCAHALGFEMGLFCMTLPIIVWWTAMGWVEAAIADIGLAVTYTVYALLFNMGYDRVFPIEQAPGAAAVDKIVLER